MKIDYENDITWKYFMRVIPMEALIVSCSKKWFSGCLKQDFGLFSIITDLFSILNDQVDLGVS